MQKIAALSLFEIQVQGYCNIFFLLLMAMYTTLIKKVKTKK